jgi:hypothetical protein
MRSQRLIRALASIALVAAIAFAVIGYRNQIADAAIFIWTNVVGSLTLIGRVIPQQIIWFFIILVLSYIAIGSFYGKRGKAEKAPPEARPLHGSVETLAEWIQFRRRGVYFNWQIANLLGRIDRRFQDAAPRGTSSRAPVPEHVRAYLDAGVNTTYADHETPGWFGSNNSVFDIPLEQALDYLEENMEINNERKN